MSKTKHLFIIFLWTSLFALTWYSLHYLTDVISPELKPMKLYLPASLHWSNKPIIIDAIRMGILFGALFSLYVGIVRQPKATKITDDYFVHLIAIAIGATAIFFEYDFIEAMRAVTLFVTADIITTFLYLGLIFFSREKNLD